MGDTYVWTGADTAAGAGSAQNLDDPNNWFDETTGAAATHAPGSADLAVFTADVSGLIPEGTSDGQGGYSVSPYEFDPATLEVAQGVHVAFATFADGSEYLLGTLEIGPSGSFALGTGTSMDAQAADISAGATLDLSQSYWIGAPLDGPPDAGEQNAVRAASSLGYPGPLNAVLGDLTIAAGGSLVLGDAYTGVSEFSNANEGSGNAFDPAAGISGAGTLHLPAAGEVAVAAVAPPTLDFGTVTIGQTVTDSFTITNTEGDAALYPLVGAIQTAANGASITDPDLSGSGVTAQDFSLPGRGGSATFTVQLAAEHAGLLQGQAINLAYEFDNGAFDQDMLIPITGDVVDPVGAACYAAGTRIATPDGWAPIEALRPGDLVRTAAGRPALVRWVGRREARLVGATESAYPVRIAAGAVAPGVPGRDLLLSPDHAVLIEGALIPAHRLLNGATIRRETACAAITYLHVELDRHDALLAEGLPAESYLDTGNRGAFAGEHGMRPMRDLAPDDRLAAALAAYAAAGCAPLHLGGAVVARAHRRLLQRARSLGWRLTRHPALTVSADAAGLALRRRKDALELRLPAGKCVLRVRSRRFVPVELDPSVPDGRRLGAALALSLDGAALPEAAFVSGWHAPEGGGAWRWTDGDACLLLASPPHRTTLLIRIMPAGARYWRAPASAPLADQAGVSLAA